MFLGPANTTGKVDQAFFYILAVSAVLLVIVTVCMLYFVFRYRKKRHPETEAVREHLWIEVIWTVIPTVLAISMFYFGWVNFDFIRTPPADALNIEVTARQWSWMFTYQDGRQSDVLRVPLNRPVKLVLTSLDVIHSLYIPAFRIKEDCVPGMKTYLWFTADRTGTYDIFCTEYCGEGHAHMLSKVIVLPQDEYDRWYATVTSAASDGAKLFQGKGCAGCHSTDGSRKVGPTLKGLFGSRETVIAGGKERVINVDEAYIKDYILHPNADVIKGYPPIMPVIPLQEKELQAIVDYIKSLK